MKKTKGRQNYNVIPFMNAHNAVSPSELDDILEDLQDMGYLTPEGNSFKSEFWRLFIKIRTK